MPNLTSAGVSVTIGDDTYHLTVLTLSDLEWLTNAMRGEIIAARTAALSGLDEKEMEEAVDQITASALSKSILGVEGLNWMQTPTGLSRLLYRYLRPEHPTISIKQCMEWLTTNPQPQLLKAAFKLFMDSMPKAPENSSKNPPTDQPTATS